MTASLFDYVGPGAINLAPEQLVPKNFRKWREEDTAEIRF